MAGAGLRTENGKPEFPSRRKLDQTFQTVYCNFSKYLLPVFNFHILQPSDVIFVFARLDALKEETVDKIDERETVRATDAEMASYMDFKGDTKLTQPSSIA